MAQGAGAEKGSAVQAGLAAQPLVTSPADVINPSATAALSDALRQGFLTADDIIQRIGPEAQAKKAANVQLLGEVVSPEQIAARRAQAEAALAGSNLNTAEAQAGLGLVEPTAQYKKELLSKENQTLWNKQAVDTFMQFNGGVPLYRKDAQGNDTDEPDVHTMAREGSEYVQAQTAFSFAEKMLQGTPRVEKDPKGVSRVVYRNLRGQDVTPVKGNAYFEHYRDIQIQAEGKLFSPKVRKPNDVNWQTEHPDNEVVSPNQPKQPPLPDVFASPSTPTVAPRGEYSPGEGYPVAPEPGTTTAEVIKNSREFRQELKNEEAYKLWDQQKGYISGFDQQAKHIDAIPKVDQQSGKVKMNTLDLGLAESLIKLFDPAAAIREFKWEKMSDKLPLQEKLSNWKAEFLRTGTFTPEARDRLIDLGYDTIKSKEQAVVQHLMRAREAADKYPDQLDKNILIGKDDEKLANGIYTARVGGPHTAATAGAPPNIITLPSGRKGYLDANGQFHDSP